MEYWQDKEVRSITGEHWEPVLGFEGLYEYSNLGRFKRLARVRLHWKGGTSEFKESIQSQSLDTSGYLQVRLTNSDGESKMYSSHRMIVSSMNGLLLPKDLEVNHRIETRKTLNILSNLEIVTHEENVNYGTRTERAIDKISKQVHVFGNGVNETFKSVRLAERTLGISQGGLSHVLNGSRKHAMGYMAEYVEVGF